MEAGKILEILDRCCDDFTFPMLDNGYVYLAATRLSLYRSEEDWALVIEVFGFSPREGIPSTAIQTFSGRPPHREFESVYPIEEGEWKDPEESERVSERATGITVRGKTLKLPTVSDLHLQGISLSEAPRMQVFELCRYLAAIARNEVLATPTERRVGVPPGMKQLLQLEEWHHPNVVDEKDRPSGSPTFEQLAKVLETGDVRLYSPILPPNTHWKNWPDGGTL